MSSLHLHLTCPGQCPPHTHTPNRVDESHLTGESDEAIKSLGGDLAAGLLLSGSKVRLVTAPPFSMHWLVTAPSPPPACTGVQCGGDSPPQQNALGCSVVVVHGADGAWRCAWRHRN